MGLKTRNTFKTDGTAPRISYKRIMAMYPSISESDAKLLALGLKNVARTTGTTENWIISELNEPVIEKGN